MRSRSARRLLNLVVVVTLLVIPVGVGSAAGLSEQVSVQAVNACCCCSTEDALPAKRNCCHEEQNNAPCPTSGHCCSRCAAPTLFLSSADNNSRAVIAVNRISVEDESGPSRDDEPAVPPPRG